jgi:hypothetical protein
MKLAAILTAVCVLVSSETGCNSRPSGPRLGIGTVQQIRDGQISFEEKGGRILVSVTDRYGDCHIHVLDHTGISREQALEILKQKEAELKTLRGEREKSGSLAEPMLEVSISEQMYRTVTCRLKNDQLVWCKHDAPKDLVIRAKKKNSTVQYVFSQTEVVSASVMLERYISQESDAPLKEISFFYTENSVKGVMYKRLRLPDECVFWLQKADAHYIITNIKRE